MVARDLDSKRQLAILSVESSGAVVSPGALRLDNAARAVQCVLADPTPDGESFMSGPIVRTGATPEFWKNWDKVFGGKKGKTEAKTAAKSKAAAPAKASKAAKPAKAAAKKSSKKK
jgi:hypothetical protein